MPPPRRPWPMKWIVIAIIVIVVPYTFVTLRYRKPGPAFRPYEDMKNRANVARLLAAGFQRVPIPAGRPADRQSVRNGAEIHRAPGGLPEALRTTLVETPLLPGDIREVIAARTANTLQSYAILLACTLPDDKQQLAGADLYLREDQLVFTPVFERVAGDLQTRSQEAVVLLTVPAGVLQPGRYEATVVGERSSRAWSLEVK